jgi:hypothetical protein
MPHPAECQLGTDKIELEHPTETLVIHLDKLAPVVREALIPLLQSLAVVERRTSISVAQRPDFSTTDKTSEIADE